MLWIFRDPETWTPAEKALGRFAAIIAIFVVQWASLLGGIVKAIQKSGWLSFDTLFMAGLLAFFVWVTVAFTRILQMAIWLEEEGAKRNAPTRRRERDVFSGQSERAERQADGPEGR